MKLRPRKRVVFENLGRARVGLSDSQVKASQRPRGSVTLLAATGGLSFKGGELMVADQLHVRQVDQAFNVIDGASR